MIMKANLTLVRRILESQLKEAVPTRGFRESIRIHQVADPVDMTQQAAEREMAVHNLDRESVVVRRVRSAIARIDDGSYGLCLQCEEEIAPKRLKAIPWAELCIECQETADRLTTKSETVRVASDRSQAA
jgi:RNA polymerase-binding transcription factor